MAKGVEEWLRFWQLWEFGTYAQRLPEQFLIAADCNNAQCIEFLEEISMHYRALKVELQS